MASLRLRRDDPALAALGAPKPLRIVASGTLFLTQQLTLSSFPVEGSATARARQVTMSRGGAATNVLSVLAQFAGVDAMLVAPLGGNAQGKMLIGELEKEGVITKYCKVWNGVNVPCAWVLTSEENDSKTIINHNPLPDITHEEFVSLLGPLLIPENYYLDPSSPPPPSVAPSGFGQAMSGSPRMSTPAALSPAPFDWLHFEGRSVKTTLSNITGIDGLARDRKWRSHCVFSLDLTKARQGVEALIPHADVIFLSRTYAHSLSTAYTTPRPFLLSLATSAAPHALLIAYWGAQEGAALLSLPTREYLQSTGWVPPPPDPLLTVHPPTANGHGHGPNTSLSVPGGGHQGNASLSLSADGQQGVGSVRSGSGFWAAGHKSSGTNSSAFTAFSSGMSHGHSLSNSQSNRDSAGQSTSPDPYTFYGGSPSSPSGENEHHRWPSPGSPSSPDPVGVGMRRGMFPPDLTSPEPMSPNGGGGDDDDDEDGSSDTTETADRRRGRKKSRKGGDSDPSAQDAFVAGMIYALSRKILPGQPYTPSARGAPAGPFGEPEKGKWKLEECLRFASELAGRKAKRKNSAKGYRGLADEMGNAGWFEL